MSKLPDFSKRALNTAANADMSAWQSAAKAAQDNDAAAGLRQTPEGIDIKPLYTAADSDCLLYTSPSPRD